jgi:ribosomal protein L34
MKRTFQPNVAAAAELRVPVRMATKNGRIA